MSLYKSVGFGKRHAVLLLIAAVLAIIAVRCAVVGAGSEQNAATPGDVARFLSGFGWEVESEPVSVKNVQIPGEFSETYASYNELQKKQGYDLSKYRTDYAVSYSFRVLNHPAGGEVFANVLAVGGRVVGGDICSYALNGFMTGFDGKTE